MSVAVCHSLACALVLIIFVQGNGADYWDGEGTNGGKTKPHPFMKCVAPLPPGDTGLMTR